jgi:hypothetical protein
MQFDAGRGFFVADAYWLPPDSDPIGPMALDVTVTAVTSPDSPTEPAKARRVQQKGFEKARWRRYYEVIGTG